MKTIKCVDNGVYFSWLINTENKWCGFQIQKHFYDEGVVLEEYNEDGEVVDTYLLELFPKDSLPYFNQEKDQIFVITIKGE